MYFTIYEKDLFQDYLKFYKFAKEVSKWSPDPDLKVGTVIINEKQHPVSCESDRVILPDDQLNLLTRKDRDLRTIPSVVMAIFVAQQDLSKCTLFTTTYPNPVSIMQIVNSGIKEILVGPPIEDYEERWGASIKDMANILEKSKINTRILLP